MLRKIFLTEFEKYFSWFIALSSSTSSVPRVVLPGLVPRSPALTTVSQELLSIMLPHCLIETFSQSSSCPCPLHMPPHSSQSASSGSPHSCAFSQLHVALAAPASAPPGMLFVLQIRGCKPKCLPELGKKATEVSRARHRRRAHVPIETSSFPLLNENSNARIVIKSY